jgi:hypothetical protein
MPAQRLVYKSGVRSLHNEWCGAKTQAKYTFPENYADANGKP